MGVLEKHRSSAPPPKAKAAAAQPPAQPTESEKPPPPKAEKVEKAPKKTGTGKTGTKSGGKSSAGQKDRGSSKKGGAAEVSSGPPLVFVPNGKEGRIRDEEKMKTLKWNFQSPRSEHIEQLKEQFTPCVSADLLGNLFHDDFKKHLAALATLTKVQLCTVSIANWFNNDWHLAVVFFFNPLDNRLMCSLCFTLCICMCRVYLVVLPTKRWLWAVRTCCFAGSL